jgi:hypothetical protein
MQRALAIIFTLAAVPAHALGVCWPECSETIELDDQTVAVSASGVGSFSVGLNETVMAEAARQTLAHGYTHMRLGDPQEYTQYSPSMFNGYRSGGFINGTVANRRTGHASVIVHMSNGGDGSLDARRILQRYGD